MNRPDKITCPCCNGKGWTDLAGVYRDTLRLLRKHTNFGREIHGAELARIAGCKATAMNNRLAYLVKHGFVYVKPYCGRNKFYVPTLKGNQ